MVLLARSYSLMIRLPLPSEPMAAQKFQISLQGSIIFISLSRDSRIRMSSLICGLEKRSPSAVFFCRLNEPPRAQEKPPFVLAPAIAPFPQSPGVPNFVLDRTLKGHTNWVTTLHFSPDGKRLVSGSWDQSLKLWDVATGRELSTIASKVTGIQASALSHNGRLIAAEDASTHKNVERHYRRRSTHDKRRQTPVRRKLGVLHRILSR